MAWLPVEVTPGRHQVAVVLRPQQNRVWRLCGNVGRGEGLGEGLQSWGTGAREGYGRGLLPGGLNLFSEIGILGRAGEMGAETAVGQGTVLTAQGPQVRVPVCSAFSLDHLESL